MENPCYRCQDRTIYCHSDCPSRNKWVIENEIRKKKIRKEQEYKEYSIGAVSRMQGNGRWG